MHRRELFSSLASTLRDTLSEEKKQEIPLRPPYNNDDSLFHNECSKCNAVCSTLCKEEIIKIAPDKTPYLDFSKSGCTYCDDCVNGCEFGVLKLENKKQIDATISINNNNCLSWNSTMCFSCKDPCLENAIDFKAMFMPSIDPTKCTSCGFCISRCPTAAVDIGRTG